MISSFKIKATFLCTDLCHKGSINHGTAKLFFLLFSFNLNFTSHFVDSSSVYLRSFSLIQFRSFFFLFCPILYCSFEFFQNSPSAKYTHPYSSFRFFLLFDYHWIFFLFIIVNCFRLLSHYERTTYNRLHTTPTSRLSPIFNSNHIRIKYCYR